MENQNESSQDESSQERSRKRRHASVEPEKAANSKQQCLSKVNLRKCPRISIDEHFKAWLADAGRPLRPQDSISQLSSPDVTTQNFCRASTISSAKSVASPRDPHYREHLGRFNIHIAIERPPPGLKEEVMNMVFRTRDSPEPDDTFVEHVKEKLRELEQPEQDMRLSGLSRILGYEKPSDERLAVLHGQLWNEAVAVPHDPIFTKPPLPLPRPKPDATFSFSRAAFNKSQLSTMDFLVQTEHGPSFASPHPRLRFPFASIEYKSLDESLRVASNEGVSTGVVALSGYMELMSRGPGLDDADLNKLLFFLVTMNPKLACISMVWVGKTSDTNRHSFHLEELDAFSLGGCRDDIRLFVRGLKNIQDYAVNTILERVTSALDTYRDKMRESINAGLVEKPQVGAESGAPPSPPQPPQNKTAKRAAPKAHTTKAATYPEQDTEIQTETRRVGTRTRRPARPEEIR